MRVEWIASSICWTSNMSEADDGDHNQNVCLSNVQQLIERILQSARRAMDGLGYDLNKKKLKEIEATLNTFYIVYERYSYRLSITAIHLHCNVSATDIQMVSMINNLLNTWHSDQCKTKAMETIQMLHQDTRDLYLNCYANVSTNIQLLQAQSKNINIPMTLRDLLFDLYYHSFVGYLNRRTLSYVWDQLFLYDWDKLQQITIQILCSRNLYQQMI
eukprot:407026_1